MSISKEVARARGQVAGYKRAVKNGERAADDPVIPASERNLAYELLADKARKLVASWPDLTDEQLDRIAAILRGGGA